MNLTTRNENKITTAPKRWLCLGMAVNIHSGGRCSDFLQNLSVTSPCNFLLFSALIRKASKRAEQVKTVAFYFGQTMVELTFSIYYI